MDIAEWLSNLGLGKYATTFAENEIDLEAARQLTDDDLRELGLPMGPRRKILAGITALPGPAIVSREQSQTPIRSEAERRQLTVMFVDMVGSTVLAGQLDPEEMGKLLRSYQNAVVGEIARLDGHVAKFMGDGVLAYFGWPRAHENEAERAVRAGLAILRAIGELQSPLGGPLAARIGIATGLVVVGDLVGQGSAREEAAVGETLHLAARLQAVAQPGRIVLAETTRRLVGELFDLKVLDSVSLKGVVDPVEAYTVLGERALESRFAAFGSERLSPIVGREQELALLLERWDRALSSEGQLVLLTGEAGIGKSRIAEALIESLADSDHTRIRYQCSPYHTDSALYPAIQHLGLAARFQAGDDEPARLDKLEALLAQGTSDVSAQAPLIAPLVGLDGTARYGSSDLSPQQLRTRVLRALIDQLAGLALVRPVLWVIEDAHWIDPTTLEFVELALDTAAVSRVLILVTARPTFEHGFGGHPIVTRLMLNRLGRAQVAAIATRVSGGKPLPDAVLDEIAAKTDGVPLFVEEIAKAVLESGVLREAEGAYVLTGPLNTLTIPATLHDSLMARLDRLRPVKEVAQMAAVIGRSFDHRTLAAIAPQTSADLTIALDGLIEAELVFRRGTPPDATYLFKHALVRDAAYESLLKSRRQTVHARLLAVLEAREDTQPELLAYHAEQAGEVAKAMDYWERAGDDAIARPAYREAISHLENALRLVRDGLRNRDDKERELRILVKLGQALIPARGYAAQTTGATFARATEVAEELGDTPLRFAAIYGDVTWNYIRSEDVTQRAKRFLALTEEAGDQGARLVALRLVAVGHFHAGRYRETLACADDILEHYDPVLHRDLTHRYGHDARISGFVYRSWSLWHLGYPDRSLETVDATLAWARERDHANTTGFALVWGVTIANALMRRGPEVVAAARLVLPLCDKLTLPFWSSFARAFLGWGLARQGIFDEALSEIDAGIAGLRATGTRRWLSLLYGLKAEARALAGQSEEADAALADAFRELEDTGDLVCALHLHCVAGHLRLEADPDAARASYEHALEIARAQGSLAIELRAATGLARLWRAQGKTRDARALLLPIYGRFTEGFGTPDLIEARALLEELR